MKRAILVHNPTAGHGQHVAEELIAWLAEAGFRARLVNAKKREELSTLKRIRGGLVVVAGGDGTVGKVARRIAGTGAALAVVPLGTANNIARSLGIEGEPKAIIAGLKRAKRRKVDVGVAKGPWGKRLFLEGVGAGLFADVMAGLHRVPRSRRKRRTDDENDRIRFAAGDKHLEGALQELAEALPRYQAKASEVSIDGVEISGSFLLVEAMNMPMVGPNLVLAPDTDPSDSRFDIVLLGEGHRQEFQSYLNHRLEGGKDAPKLSVMKGRKLSFAWSGPRLHIDDKSVSMRNPIYRSKSETVKVKIKHGALEFLIPRLKGVTRRPKLGQRARPRPLEVTA